ncbi:hypothetical protein [Nannocystis pusilla]|uniref:hypothetical protein n=1 Tax=Nannocystis pusilla TaxID=889268 RepID=UPI003B7BA8ED
MARPSTGSASASGASARLQAHFHEVLLELRGRDVTHLGAPQRAARERLIEELARYAREGRFPRNSMSREPLPIFIDPHGTRCAMARLIESTGHAALVARVATHRNFALIRELEGDAALQAWLDEFGLTAAEAGRIQPEYCFLTKAEDCFCNQLGSRVPSRCSRASSSRAEPRRGRGPCRRSPRHDDSEGRGHGHGRRRPSGGRDPDRQPRAGRPGGRLQHPHQPRAR